MEDKMFELMTKMYNEFSEFRKDITQKVQENSNHILKLSGDVVRLENKVDTNSKALFDGYTQVYEKLGTLEGKVDTLSSKVEKQDVEIRVIKGGK